MTSTPHHENWIARILRRAASSALGLAVVLVPTVVGTQPAHAQTYSVLYTFKGKDGAFPFATLIRDAAGGLYGTTARGGADIACSDKTGCGTVFKVSPTGKERLLHSFTGLDGRNPYAGLIRDVAGNLYGTTYAGGNLTCPVLDGCGTVFRLDTTGTETVLYSFTGGTDGRNPNLASLVRDPAGNLYGTTQQGGALTCDCGTVFKLDTSGNKTILHTFLGGTDGSQPLGGLVGDPAGNLYGTTEEGGAYGVGTVFRIDGNGNETVLHAFAGHARGLFPWAGLVRDSAGNLYGTTPTGGDPTCECGIVFRLDGNGNETVLHKFTGEPDGGFPNGTLIRDAAGNLYGTTERGGVGFGTVFKLDANGTVTILYSFTGGVDGRVPAAGLVQDAAGSLYGTTYAGGDLECMAPRGCGVVFKITP